MQECWRWFGPEDPVTLRDVRQAGATGVVTALHDVPNGCVWGEDAIADRLDMIHQAGLDWAVVESIPVHENIKTGAAGWENYAHNWAETARRLARQGVTTICYNFMPVLDWTRTDLEYPMPDGALALRFEHAAYVAFDLLILERDGARLDYSDDEIAAARAWMSRADDADKEKLTRNVLAGLPGSEESYSLDSFRAQLATYAGVDADQMRRNLKAFLDIVIPVAQSEGFRLAIHPDDPPTSIFGLPRVVSTASDLKTIAALIDTPENGFTLCTGSLGVRADNDMQAIIDEIGSRIHFAHLRSTRREANPKDFHEAPHLGGDLDMVGVVSRLLDLCAQRGLALPMRPDHGHKMLSDLTRPSLPGYPAIGRLRGLAELRGIMHALRATRAG